MRSPSLSRGGALRARTKRLSLGGGVVLVAVWALTLGGATAANAHVGIEEGTVTAGAYEILTFSVPHGCEGSPTTKITIGIPEGINTVTPTRNSFYTVQSIVQDLTQPVIDSDGAQITQRIDRVVYAASIPLPADQRDVFELSLQIPEDAAGQTLNFPVVQTCAQGETAWVQSPEGGQDAHDLEAPAPSIVVRAADSASTSGDQTPLVVTSLVVGLLGLASALFALLRRPKKA